MHLSLKRLSATACKPLLAGTVLMFCALVGLWCCVRVYLRTLWRWVNRRCWRCWRGTRQFYRHAASPNPVGAVYSDYKFKQATRALAHHMAKPDWVKPELLRLMAHMPRASVRLLAMTFNRLHLAKTGVSVGRSFVYEYRLRCRHAVVAARRELKARAPIEYAKNHTWGLDLTGKQITVVANSGKVMSTNHYVLGLIDHGSRLLLTLATLRSKHSWRLAGWVALTALRYGAPTFIKTDNDAVFTSKLFKACLAALGIAHKRTQVMSPWQNGRIERLFGTLKRPLDLVSVSSFAALGRLMATFRFFYNEVRPHQALGGLTPVEVWAGLGWQVIRVKPWKTVMPFRAWSGLLVGFVTTR